MKIGIVADIHGALDGLHKALTLFESQQVDHIVCAGDLVDKGEQPNEVIALLRERGIPCVMGNHDLITAKSDNSLEDWLLEQGITHFSSLRPESRAYLRTLPATLRFTWDGLDVLLAHGTPWAVDTYLFPKALPRVFTRVANETKSDIVILGHTHVPMVALTQNCLIVNPGSIYGNYNTDDRTCGVLTLPEKHFTVTNVDTRRTVVPDFVRIKPSDR